MKTPIIPQVSKSTFKHWLEDSSLPLEEFQITIFKAFIIATIENRWILLNAFPEWFTKTDIYLD